MVIIYKVLARYSTTRGQAYTEIGYYLERSIAYAKALEYFDKRGSLSAVNKVIIQEISIGAYGAGIKNVDYINS